MNVDDHAHHPSDGYSNNRFVILVDSAHCFSIRYLVYFMQKLNFEKKFTQKKQSVRNIFKEAFS